ncbi:hypothetical protein DASC09_041110 [Saccharomycopsis crataegensis]|uniref:Uncharacterized protein n=1 Tax=Saccharomycopsis crataegensis TaxID=43959 RepID=A0AAV5QQG9_9ASCO|nr:hypothetical protein DASC09_041110 [Saccharomycopsis crataegensis]
MDVNISTSSLPSFYDNSNYTPSMPHYRIKAVANDPNSELLLMTSKLSLQYANLFLSLTRMIKRCSPLTVTFTPLRATSCYFRVGSVTIRSVTTGYLTYLYMMKVSEVTNVSPMALIAPGKEMVINNFLNSPFQITNFSEQISEHGIKWRVQSQPREMASRFFHFYIDMSLDQLRKRVVLTSTMVPASTGFAKVVCGSTRGNGNCSVSSSMELTIGGTVLAKTKRKYGRTNE